MKKGAYIQFDVRLLSDRKMVQKWLKEKSVIAYTYIDPAMPQFSVDILSGESLQFDTFDKHKVLIEAWDTAIPVISIDDLIGMKKRRRGKKISKTSLLC